MADLIEGGWLHLTDGTDNMYIKFTNCKAQWVWIEVQTKHYKSSSQQGSHYGYWFGGSAWQWTFEELYFETHQDYLDFCNYLWDWEYNDQGFTLGVYRDGASNYWQFDGSNNTYTVLCKTGLPEITKKPAAQQIYVVKNIQFEQSG